MLCYTELRQSHILSACFHNPQPNVETGLDERRYDIIDTAFSNNLICVNEKRIKYAVCRQVGLPNISIQITCTKGN